MAKIGRNDPCPCGSGKKYKHCHGGIEAKFIPFPGQGAEVPPFGTGNAAGFPEDDSPLTFMEREGRPNMATEVLKQLQAEMSARVFASDEELQAFVRGAMERRQKTPIADFLGITPDQMQRILYGGIEALGDILELSDAFSETDAGGIPLLDACRYLLRALAEAGAIKATAKGNLPRALVQSWWDSVIAPGLDDEGLRKVLRPRGEEEAGELGFARRVAVHAGLVKLRKGIFSLTEKARRLLERGKAATLYGELFKTVGWKIDWNADRDYRLEFHPLAQESFVFTLHLLGSLATAWTPEEVIVDGWLRAFPTVREEFANLDPKVFDDFKSYSLAVSLTSMPIELGLLERRGGWDQKERRMLPYEYRITSLFGRVLRWKL
jgi:hypothetical protein